MRKLAILLCVLGVAAFANAATIQYKILINDQDLATVDSTIVTPGTPFKVSIQVNTPDSDDFGGVFGGVLGAGYNLSDVGNALTPQENTSFVVGQGVVPDGKWKATFVGPYDIKLKGELGGEGYDVYAQTHAFMPGSESDYLFTVGAGDGVWSTIAYGNFTWDGNATTLGLDTTAAWNRIMSLTGPQEPDTMVTDSVAFVGVPEPATMGLLLVGGVAALIRRRK